MPDKLEPLILLDSRDAVRVALYDMQERCSITLQAGQHHYCVQMWNPQDAEAVACWLAAWVVQQEVQP